MKIDEWQEVLQRRVNEAVWRWETGVDMQSVPVVLRRAVVLMAEDGSVTSSPDVEIRYEGNSVTLIPRDGWRYPGDSD